MIFFVLEMVFWVVLAESGIESHIHWTLNPKAFELLTIVASAAWMEPVKEHWAIHVAYIVLLIPSFVLSGYLESRLMVRQGMLKFEGRCTAIIWQANALSYIFLATFGSFALIKGLTLF